MEILIEQNFVNHIPLRKLRSGLLSNFSLCCVGLVADGKQEQSLSGVPGNNHAFMQWGVYSAVSCEAMRRKTLKVCPTSKSPSPLSLSIGNNLKIYLYTECSEILITNF